jgi:hypothetical protein
MARDVTTAEWGRIIANAWLDPAFAHALTTDPAKAAKSFLGLTAHEELNLFEVPAKPADLSKPQLEEIRDGKAKGVIAIPAFSC